MRKDITDEVLVSRWLNTKRGAAERGIEFSLSLKRMRQLMNTKKCFYTGILMSHEDKDPDQLTFDRMDNTIGYTDDNVVACTSRINKAKGNLTIPELIVIYNNIQKRHGKRRN